LPAQPSRSQTGDIFFTARDREVDSALLHAIDDHADQVRQAERRRHVRVHFSRQLVQVIQMFSGEDERFQLVHSGGSSSCFGLL
jgi:hypothetical protein